MNFCLDIHGKTVFWILLHQSPKIRMNTKKKDTRHRHKRKIKIKKKPRTLLARRGSRLGSVDEKDTRWKREWKGKIKNWARNANCVQAQPGVPGAIRTRGLSLRRRTLYPAELRRQILVLFFDPIDEQKTAIRRKESYLLYDIRRAKSTAEFWNFPIQCTGSGNRFGVFWMWSFASLFRRYGEDFCAARLWGL